MNYCCHSRWNDHGCEKSDSHHCLNGVYGDHRFQYTLDSSHRYNYLGLIYWLCIRCCYIFFVRFSFVCVFPANSKSFRSCFCSFLKNQWFNCTTKYKQSQIFSGQVRNIRLYPLPSPQELEDQSILVQQQSF